ncbi:MAG: ATP-dependent DNA helicase [Burkholderiaceae bacterium]
MAQQPAEHPSGQTNSGLADLAESLTRVPVTDSELNQRVEIALGPDGPFASQVNGYADRPSQRQLAASIASAIAGNNVLIAEAGTGIGKTFAYLVPALLADCKVLISTGTKNLQDQLFSRDLPAVKAALGVGPTTALLKGRSNYICKHHLQKNLTEGKFERRSDIAVLQRMDKFAAISNTGDRAEAPGIAEDAPAWMMATSTRENCLGQDCSFIDDCFVFKARRKAMASDIVVINHHLFCADMALRDDGVSEILPTAQVLIFDEAHQLPETATNFFGRNTSTRQLIDFTRDCLRVGRADAPDSGDWLGLTGAIEQCLRELRLAAGQPGRVDESGLRAKSKTDFFDALSGVCDSLNAAGEVLLANAERSRDLDLLHTRSRVLISRIQAWVAGALGTESAGPAAASGDISASDGKSPSNPTVDGLESGQAWPDDGTIDGSMDGPNDSEADESVHWLDIHRNGLTMHRTPLSVAEPFRRQIASTSQAWIFTSATLAIGENFSMFVNSMGLEGERTERHESPFDFQNQALLYVPEGIGEPRERDFARNLLDAVIPLLRANNGRAFFLCTSLRMVDTVAERLRLEFGSGDAADAADAADAMLGSLEADEPGFTILAQGAGPRDLLLSQFRERARPILIGSASFWEGVDVVGQQLSLVVIDKLPFAPPDDPILQARADAMRRRGVQPFTAMHLPRAGMALKQGAGRLIRSESDRGLLVIGDVRLAEKAYGRQLLRGLPPFKRTRKAHEALQFVTDGVGD